MAVMRFLLVSLLLNQLCIMSSGRLVGGRNLGHENNATEVAGIDESDIPTRIFPKKLGKKRTETSAQEEVKDVEETDELFNKMKDTRIIGGSLSTKGRYPYAVSLKRGAGAADHFCGGSLIAKDVVLSAAHCATSRYDVAIGRHSLNSAEGKSISVKGQLRHPQYASSGVDNDFLLIFLSESADADIVSLNSVKTEPVEGDSVTVMGWGDTVASNSYSQLSNTLREVEVKVVSNQNCAQSQGYVGSFYNSYDGQITGNMLCAKDSGEDACQGDSGGPLVLKGSNGSTDVQVGVVSWGVGCASANFPGVYARISSAYDWIKAEVCNRSLDPPSEFECSSSKDETSAGDTDGTEETSTCERFSFDLRTDGHASEISWELVAIDGNEETLVGSGPPENISYSNNTPYKDAASGCLKPGEYRFTIYDSYGDGISEPGYYRITVNGEVLELRRTFGADYSTNFSVGSTAQNGDTTTETLLEEDFKSGYGQFSAGGKDVLHYSNILGRDGVARLESGNGMESSIYSDEISLAGKAYAGIRVTFSFYGNSMEFYEQICVDYMVNNVQNWTEVKCFASGRNFANDRWYDNVSVSISLQVDDNIDSMRVRFRCDANSIHDDILISQVKIAGTT